MLMERCEWNAVNSAIGTVFAARLPVRNEVPVLSVWSHTLMK